MAFKVTWWGYFLLILVAFEAKNNVKVLKKIPVFSLPTEIL
jgi:hypothetical protein